MGSGQLKQSELVKLVRWADTAKNNEEFWKRIMIASTIYPIENMLRMSELFKLANGEPTIDTRISNY